MKNLIKQYHMYALIAVLFALASYQYWQIKTLDSHINTVGQVVVNQGNGLTEVINYLKQVTQPK